MGTFASRQRCVKISPSADDETKRSAWRSYSSSFFSSSFSVTGETPHTGPPSDLPKTETPARSPTGNLSIDGAAFLSYRTAPTQVTRLEGFRASISSASTKNGVNISTSASTKNAKREERIILRARSISDGSKSSIGGLFPPSRRWESRFFIGPRREERRIYRAPPPKRLRCDTKF